MADTFKQPSARLRLLLPALLVLWGAAGGLPATTAAAQPLALNLDAGFTLGSYLDHKALDSRIGTQTLPHGMMGKHDRDASMASYDTQSLLARAWLQPSLTILGQASLVATLDTGEQALSWLQWNQNQGSSVDADWTIDGLAPETALANAMFLRELWLEWAGGQNDWLLLQVGKKRSQILDGLFYDDFGFQALADAELWRSQGRSLRLVASALVPYHYAPQFSNDLLVLDAQVVYSPFPFDSLRLGLTCTRDRSNLLMSMTKQVLVDDLLADAATVAATALEATPLVADLDLYQAYASVDLSLGPFVVGGIAAYQWGEGHFRSAAPASTRSADWTGHLGLLTLDTDLPRARLGLFWLLVSGLDRGQAKDFKFTRFMSLVPNADLLSIFFSGGLSPTLARRDFGLLGHASAGASVLGLRGLVGWHKDLVSTHSVAMLGPNRPEDPLASASLGWEQDNSLDWAFREGLSLGAELDFFVPGSFFHRASTQTRVVLNLEGTL
jgi:hypothetical protein